MSKLFYYLEGDQQKGPCSIDQLKTLGIKSDTFVWTNGLENWIPAKNVGELAVLFWSESPPSKPVIPKPMPIENATVKKKWYAKKGCLIGVAVVVALIVIAIVASDDENSTSSSTQKTIQETTQKTTQETTQKAPEPAGVGIGEVLKTKYFDITVNSVNVRDRVRTGNTFADLPPEKDIKYLIINATFKNIDTESRTIMDGSVWINYNGKDYEFDKSETVLHDGWGLFFDQINPLTTKTTNLVYKIPAEIKGVAYWQPGRANKNQKILLGNL